MSSKFVVWCAVAVSMSSALVVACDDDVDTKPVTVVADGGAEASADATADSPVTADAATEAAADAESDATAEDAATDAADSG